MKIIATITVSAITGIIALMAYYDTFSKDVEKFYEDASKSIDVLGVFVGYFVKGLHSIYKRILPRHHVMAVRVTTFIVGSIFLIISIGVWFINLSAIIQLGFQ